MKLFLVQHGQQIPEEQDSSEPLSEKGIADVAAVAKWAQQAGVTIDEIFHSAKLRAKQTAEIFAEYLSPPREIEEKEGLKPLDDITSWLDTLEYYQGNLMLVGHLPFMSKLASFLLAHTQDEQPVRFQQGGLVCIEKDEDDAWHLLYAVTPNVV
jgi:phosphohistidine phosphatase